MPIKIKVDAVGRVRIPKAFRDALNISAFDSILMEYDSVKQVLEIFKAKRR